MRLRPQPVPPLFHFTQLLHRSAAYSFIYPNLILISSIFIEPKHFMLKVVAGVIADEWDLRPTWWRHCRRMKFKIAVMTSLRTNETYDRLGTVSGSRRNYWDGWVAIESVTLTDFLSLKGKLMELVLALQPQSLRITVWGWSQMHSINFATEKLESWLYNLTTEKVEGMHLNCLKNGSD